MARSSGVSFTHTLAIFCRFPNSRNENKSAGIHRLRCGVFAAKTFVLHCRPILLAHTRLKTRVFSQPHADFLARYARYAMAVGQALRSVRNSFPIGRAMEARPERRI